MRTNSQQETFRSGAQSIEREMNELEKPERREIFELHLTSGGLATIRSYRRQKEKKKKRSGR
jgi:hypothetical protein